MLNRKIQTVLGLMSGTSLDGVDAAVLKTDGVEIHGFGKASYRAYTGFERETLHAALGCWPGDDKVAAASRVVETAHAEVMAGFDGIDLAGFHGQTLAHDPAKGRTHQAGSGAVLAALAGYPVVWDFRTADMVAGGQGAPLAPFFHFALARWIKAQAPLVFLNLGGVGNLTWVDPTMPLPEAEGALLAFDTGPANAPLDDLCKVRLGRAQDAEGRIAATGIPDMQAVAAYLNEAYFFAPPPKSLDRAAPELAARVAGLPTADALATVSEAVAGTVARGFDHLPGTPAQVLVCGGGRHNTDLMRRLAAHLPCAVVPVEAAGLDGDMIEAQAFAYLAMRVTYGLPTSCQMTTGVATPVVGGQISHP